MKKLVAAAFLLASLVLASSGGTARERFVCPDRSDPPNCIRVPNEQLHYQPAVVKLSGLLVTEYVYGPPGFGEDPEVDLIDRVWQLRLFAPVDVIGTPGDDINSESENDVGRVGLVNFSKANLIAHLGRRFMVEGTLFHSHTAHHHTKVLLEVQKVTRLKAKPPRPSVGTMREIPAPAR
jgi:hypothetical protein